MDIQRLADIAAEGRRLELEAQTRGRPAGVGVGFGPGLLGGLRRLKVSR
ncbi:hypothetical protein ACPPVO_37290 [Dactylosporangium sp. McL0621]